MVVDDRRIKHEIDIVELIEGCADNQVVVVEVLNSPTIEKNASGRITSIIGNYLDEGVEVDSAIHRHEIPAIFGDKALEETAKLPFLSFVRTLLGSFADSSRTLSPKMAGISWR